MNEISGELGLDESLNLRAQLQTRAQTREQEPVLEDQDLSLLTRARKLMLEGLSSLSLTEADSTRGLGRLLNPEEYHWLDPREFDLLWSEGGRLYKTSSLYAGLLDGWIVTSLAAPVLGGLAASFWLNLQPPILALGAGILAGLAGWAATGWGLGKVMEHFLQPWRPETGEEHVEVLDKLAARMEWKLIQKGIMSERSWQHVKNNPRSREVLELLEAWTEEPAREQPTGESS